MSKQLSRNHFLSLNLKKVIITFFMDSFHTYVSPLSKYIFIQKVKFPQVIFNNGNICGFIYVLWLSLKIIVCMASIKQILLIL